MLHEVITAGREDQPVYFIRQYITKMFGMSRSSKKVIVVRQFRFQQFHTLQHNQSRTLTFNVSSLCLFQWYRSAIEWLICIILYPVKWIYYAASLNRLTSCNLIPVVYGFQQNMITSFITPKNKQKITLEPNPSFCSSLVC